MDRSFISDRITTTKSLIIAYENAIAALGTQGGVQSYTLDSGQSRQTVTRADLPRLNAMVDSLENRLATLEARLYGGGTLAGPDW